MAAAADSVRSERAIRLAEIKRLEEAEAIAEEAVRARAGKEGCNVHARPRKGIR